LKGTSRLIQVSIPAPPTFFEVLSPKGTYYAWAPSYNLEGAYVHSDLTMKSFVVKGGQATSGINLTDWSPYPHSRGD
jgi:hypothetical protein